MHAKHFKKKFSKYNLSKIDKISIVRNNLELVKKSDFFTMYFEMKS